MSDYFTADASHRRSSEWLSLIDAANNWQQAYDHLLYWEANAWTTDDETRTEQARKAEQLAYDEWTHALVAFERAENTRRMFA